MLVTLYRSAAVWTGLGLLSGLYYRTLTQSQDFSGGTQLSVVHTHTLALGTLMFLALLALAQAFSIGADARFRWAVRLWNVGLAISAGTLTVKGTLQVLENAAADSPAIAGISGLGHITLTLAFGALFHVLGPAVRRAAAAKQ